MSMRIARNLGEAMSFAPCAVTIGNFDGVHLGHRALVSAMVEEARARKLTPTVLMFSPHPAHVVAPERAPKLMMTPDERCEELAKLGVEAVLILPFNTQLASLSPEQFTGQYLRDVLKAGIVLVGDNFRFGHNQAGDTETLTALGARMGFATRFVEAVRWRGQMVSASAIRRLIAAGEVYQAARLLTRPYEIGGDIVSGHGIGSKQTVPTLNLRTDAQVLPASGVYITRTSDVASDRLWNSITNIGYRPTFALDDGLTIETFILGGAGQAEFGQNDKLERIHLKFLRHVRDERKFESPEALKTQILRDVGRAQAYFRRLARWVKQTESS